MGPLTYEVQCGPRPSQVKVLHVNHLKSWYEAIPSVPTVAWVDITPLSTGELPWTALGETGKLPPIAHDLTLEQRLQVQAVVSAFPSLLSNIPGHTQNMWHTIETLPHHMIPTP